MLSLRSVARLAPRTLARAGPSSSLLLRQPAFSSANNKLLRKGALSARGGGSPAASVALFSASAPGQHPARDAAADGAYEAEEMDLSTKLESELMLEEQLKNEAEPGEEKGQQSAAIKDFLGESQFKLHDVPGQEMVKLVRNYNDEKITVSFSIADITNYNLPFDGEEEEEEDPAFDDEDETPAGAEDPATLQNANQQRGVPARGGARSAPAEEALDEEAEGSEEEGLDEGIPPNEEPIGLAIVIEKPGKTKSALAFEASVVRDSIHIGNVFHFEDASLAHNVSPEAVHSRTDTYPGPPFVSLDEDLQLLLERYLEDRGVDRNMAAFVPEYVDVKEQAEYVRWLGNVKAFVDA